MNYNFLKVFFLQSNNAIDGIGAVILYTALVIVIFLIIREIVMWYWKINERITHQKSTNDLIQQTNSLLQSLISSIENLNISNKTNNNDSKNNIENVKVNNVNYEENLKLKNEDLNAIISNYTAYSREVVLTAIKITKDKNIKLDTNILSQIFIILPQWENFGMKSIR